MSALLGLLLGGGAHFGREALQRRAVLNPNTVKGNAREYQSDLVNAFQNYVGKDLPSPTPTPTPKSTNTKFTANNTGKKFSKGDTSAYADLSNSAIENSSQLNNAGKKFDVEPEVHIQYDDPSIFELDVYLNERKRKAAEGKSFDKDVHSSPRGREFNIVDLPANATKDDLAESLGQIVYEQSDLGKFIAKSDKYKDALAIAASIVPAGYAVLNSGHDDFAGSMALATLLNAPHLAKKFGSKYHALRMMDQANMPTTGSAMRMSGTSLLDFSVPMIQASAGNLVGSMFDAPNYDFTPR